MKNLSPLICLVLLLAIGIQTVQAQTEQGLVQFSGMILTEEDGTGDIIPIPFASVYLKESGRGTYSNLEGFFSIVAKAGEHVEFSGTGFKTQVYTIPDSLSSDRYSMIQIMTKDTFLLPETVVYPWPSREYFKQEFLTLEVPNELEALAKENLNPEVLARLQETLPRSGEETGAYYLRQQAQSYYYFGQAPPQNIFSPLAWQKFIKSWRNGDFKRKNDTKDN